MNYSREENGQKCKTQGVGKSDFICLVKKQKHQLLIVPFPFPLNIVQHENMECAGKVFIKVYGNYTGLEKKVNEVKEDWIVGRTIHQTRYARGVIYL